MSEIHFSHVLEIQFSWVLECAGRLIGCILWLTRGLEGETGRSCVLCCETDHLGRKNGTGSQSTRGGPQRRV
jgi:hypothetical protein